MLVVPIIVLMIWHFITFDPHKRCTDGVHRHVDGFLGVALLSLFWFYCWLVFILLEVIYSLLKKYFMPKG